MIFHEHYRPVGGLVPAWACDSPTCGYRQFPRGVPTARELIQASRQVQARARRTAMKARALTQRASAGIDRTHALIKKKHA